MRGLKGIGNFLTYKLLEKHYQNERFMFGKAFQSFTKTNASCLVKLFKAYFLVLEHTNFLLFMVHF